jgi:hypothetical protein
MQGIAVVNEMMLHGGNEAVLLVIASFNSSLRSGPTDTFSVLPAPLPPPPFTKLQNNVESKCQMTVGTSLPNRLW